MRNDAGDSIHNLLCIKIAEWFVKNTIEDIGLESSTGPYLLLFVTFT